MYATQIIEFLKLWCLLQVSLDSKVTLEHGEAQDPRLGTMSLLSHTDASSFSSISSLSTATDFSVSAASGNDEYCELRGMADDESGFMEVNLHSRNSFEKSRNDSQDSGIDDKQLTGCAKPKRRGLTGFLARSVIVFSTLS